MPVVVRHRTICLRTIVNGQYNNKLYSFDFIKAPVVIATTTIKKPADTYTK